jgi:hypothetical protein
MRIDLARIAVLTLITATSSIVVAQEPGNCINSDEAELLQLVDDYRIENDLSAVPWSQTLMTVGQWHAVDAAENGATIFESPCNLHSWSEPVSGLWSGMCYTSDHAQRARMWIKPREISNDVYTASGFENAAWGYTSVAAALQGWKSSSGHNNVILNKSVWAGYPWNAMGVGVDLIHKYYFLWFSTGVDPLGDMSLCGDAEPPIFADGFETD